VGRALILPEDPLADLILIATGTGIAPFRAHLRRLFHPVERELRLSPAFLGRVSLFFGTTSRANLLYCEEIEALQGQSGGQLDLSCALSREERAPDGGRMYVQHRLEERGEELVARLRSPHARVYLCGLRGMEKGVEEALGRAGGAEVVARLKAERRWRVEVY
jgi:ferredoxin--NADP+ reductase